jgi:hypothetical protein
VGLHLECGVSSVLGWLDMRDMDEGIALVDEGVLGMADHDTVEWRPGPAEARAQRIVDDRELLAQRDVLADRR